MSPPADALPGHVRGGLVHARKMEERAPHKACPLCLLRLGFGCKMVARMIATHTPETVYLWGKQIGKPTSKGRHQDWCEDFMRRRVELGPKLKTKFRFDIDDYLSWQRIGDEATHWLNHPERRAWLRRSAASDRAKRKTPYHLAKLLRSRVYNVLRGNKKSRPTEELLGCSWEEAREFIESKFKRGMTWDNHGKLWHIDHVVPCASFDLSDAKQQRLCFHFTNLQPLRADENRMKRDLITNGQLPLCI